MRNWRLYGNAFRTILTKEILRFSRIWIQTVLPPMVTTSLYFVIFGRLIGSRLGDMDGHPYVDFILCAEPDELFRIAAVSETKLPAGRPHDFNTIICTECGEVAVERYARVKDGKIVCMPCAEKR